MAVCFVSEQKTAYERRISDSSSDVCSSDLHPIWHSLDERHAAFALRAGTLARYPADVAPFLAIADGVLADGDALAELVAADEVVYLLGAEPGRVEGWSVRAEAMLLQMHCPQLRAAVAADADIIALDASHRADDRKSTRLNSSH